MKMGQEEMQDAGVGAEAVKIRPKEMEMGDGLGWGPQIWGMRNREDGVGYWGRCPGEEDGGGGGGQLSKSGPLPRVSAWRHGPGGAAPPPCPLPGLLCLGQERPLWVLRCCGPVSGPDLCAHRRIGRS